MFVIIDCLTKRGLDPFEKMKPFPCMHPPYWSRQHKYQLNTLLFRIVCCNSHFMVHSSWKVSDELGPKWPWYICLLMAQLEFTWWKISLGHWNIKLYRRIKPDNVALRKEFYRTECEPLISHTNYLWFFSPPPLQYSLSLIFFCHQWRHPSVSCIITQFLGRLFQFYWTLAGS